MSNTDRLELETLRDRLLTRYDATTGEDALRVGALVMACCILLDARCPFAPDEIAECQRELLRDAAAVGVPTVH